VAGNILDSVWYAGIIEIPKWRQRAMAAQLGQGDPNAFEPAAANENVPRERTG
jgi:hypothetical protein